MRQLNKNRSAREATQIYQYRYLHHVFSNPVFAPTYSSNIILVISLVCNCFMSADLLLESPHLTFSLIATWIQEYWNSRTFQGLRSVFKHFSRQTLFSRTFQDCPSCSSTFQACANPYLVFNQTWPFLKLVQYFIKANILKKFHDYPTENVASTAYIFKFWPSDLVFDPTWLNFKLIEDLFHQRKHSDQISWVSDQKCGL